MSTGIPTLRLELEGMRHSVQFALSSHALAMDQMLKDAVDRYCSEGSLNQVIAQEVQRSIDEAVKAEVRAFFQHSGQGRTIIKDAVLKHLKAQEKHYEQLSE